MIKIRQHMRCETCVNYDLPGKNAGTCTKLGVMGIRGEFILDGIDMFEKLGVQSIEYRHPTVRNGFACIYWKQKD